MSYNTLIREALDSMLKTSNLMIDWIAELESRVAELEELLK